MTREYAVTCRELGAEHVRFVATSASRDARNAADFIEGVRTAFQEHFGAEVAPEVVERRRGGRALLRRRDGRPRRQGVSGPYLVVDLGGGSTEFVRGTDHVEAARSVDIGCVRLTERHLASDPPTAARSRRPRATSTPPSTWPSSPCPSSGVATLVGLAGSVTTITAHLLRLPAYEAERIHLARSAPADMIAASSELLSMSRAQRAALPYMHPGRVDVIGAGALVWRRIVARVVERSGITEVVTSEHDILDGIALSQVARAYPALSREPADGTSGRNGPRRPAVRRLIAGSLRPLGPVR